MYALVIQANAVQSMQEAYDWYEEQQPGLGELFLKEIERCFDKLEKSPLHYAIIKKKFRQIILNTFPYVIVFELINTDVVVYCVFHTSQSLSKKFKGRTK